MLGRLIALLIAGSTAVATSQLPEFVQQYTQRLGGALDELTTFVTQFDKDAEAAGLNREQALDAYRRSQNSFLGQRRESVVGIMDRYERLSSLKKSLEQSGPVVRIGTFFKELESDIAENTWSDFQPAVPVTIEGAIHAGAGFLLGLILYGAGRGAGRGIRRGIGGPKAAPDPE